MESLEEYLEALASAAPTPGGGSAATMVGAMGAALVAMVARVTANNSKFAHYAEAAEMLARSADGTRAQFMRLRIEDERAYAAVVQAMALPRSDDAEKERRYTHLQDALKGAANAPYMCAQLGTAVMTMAL